MKNTAGDGSLQYRFYATDGMFSATGNPTSDSAISVSNNQPSLAWTGQVPYGNDGVNPDPAPSGSTFEFRVKFTDLDNTPPDPIQLLVDLNGDTDYVDDGEVIIMNEVEAGDTDYRDGKLYSTSTDIFDADGSTHNYRFNARDKWYAYITDGTDIAVGAPTSDQQFTVEAVANYAPVLTWATGTNCQTEGVRPRTGAVNAAFEFMVKYSDMDGDCPTSIQVTVNEISYDLTHSDGASCQTGRTYSEPVTIVAPGDFNYSFSASDGEADATGTPTTNHMVSVINTPYKVRTSLVVEPGWYNSVAGAVGATTGASTIMVYPNSSDFSAATYTGGISFSSKPDRTLQSVCGRDLTIISGGGTSVITVGSTNVIIDGFTITGGSSNGLYYEVGSSITGTIKNSAIFTMNQREDQ